LNTQQILELDEIRELFDEIPQAERAKLAQILVRFGHKAEAKAQTMWKRRKAPLAEYWFTTAVNARHFARALRQARAPVLL
jgi:hypothetical protein